MAYLCGHSGVLVVKKRKEKIEESKCSDLYLHLCMSDMGRHYFYFTAMVLFETIRTKNSQLVKSGLVKLLD